MSNSCHASAFLVHVEHGSHATGGVLGTIVLISELADFSFVQIAPSSSSSAATAAAFSPKSFGSGEAFKPMCRHEAKRATSAGESERAAIMSSNLSSALHHCNAST